jgi:cytochrome c5
MRLTVTILTTGMLLLAGCAFYGSDGNGRRAVNGINGEEAYLNHCAGCHETGILGAPRAGAKQDWESRSNLWQAVLMEHAKEGYFEMPARGGKMDLPDEVVSAAAEYMLEKTFPDRPKD